MFVGCCAKLGPHSRVLTTIRGRGYRFDPGADVQYLASRAAARAAYLYRVAVSGPVGRQTDCGGFPFDEHPLPVEMYVAPGRYGWKYTCAGRIPCPWAHCPGPSLPCSWTQATSRYESDSSQAPGVSVAVTTLVPESCATCGGDSVYEHGGAPGSP
jgi:hypothetical protein